MGRGLGDGVLDAMYNLIRHTKKLSRSKVIDQRLDVRKGCGSNSLGVFCRDEAETAGAIDFAPRPQNVICINPSHITITSCRVMDLLS